MSLTHGGTQGRASSRDTWVRLRDIVTHPEPLDSGHLVMLGCGTIVFAHLYDTQRWSGWVGRSAYDSLTGTPYRYWMDNRHRIRRLGLGERVLPLEYEET